MFTMRSVSHSVILFVLFLLCSCRKQDEIPQYTSFDLRTDGSHSVSNIGVPSSSSKLAFGDSNSSTVWISSPAVPLLQNGKYSYVVAFENTLTVGNETESRILMSLPQEQDISHLLADTALLIAVHHTGITGIGFDGKVLWQQKSVGVPRISPIFAENIVVIASDSGIHTFDSRSGSAKWFYRSGLPVESVIYDPSSKCIVVALTHNDADAADSIVCLSGSGAVMQRSSFVRQRIISNLCLCGVHHDRIAFGYLGQPDAASSIRKAHVAIYSSVETGKPKLVSDHEVPYLPTSISSNGEFVLSSGNRIGISDASSGIDAFSAEDTLKIWQRRLSYPVNGPVGVSEKYAYFIQTFSTQAEIPTQSIFISLDLPSGKTLGELPIQGARSGIGNAVPIPIAGSAFMLVDRSRPVLYFLKP